MYKVMSDEKLHLDLGDIIQIIAPDDSTLNNKQFFINYIDDNEIELLDNEGNTRILYITPEKTFRNESIESIDILDRDKESGYARQNGLLPDTWVNLRIGGDRPTVIIGKITNLVEDQIEITIPSENPQDTTDKQDVIYIDFAYRGIPRDIPIESIEIRESPPGVDQKQAERLEDTPSVEADIEKGERLDLTMPEIQEQIMEMTFSADQIDFGEELEEFDHIVEVPDEMKKFSIEQQTNDLLDDLLSNIPNRQRTTKIINNIHKTIERYKQLRKEFSIFDQNYNIIGHTEISNDHKPIVHIIERLKKKLYWTMPIARNKKKLYDVETFGIEEERDIVDMSLANSRIEEADIVTEYFQNDIGGDNKYHTMIKKLSPFYIPFESPAILDGILASKSVNTTISAVIDNLDDLDTSVAKDNLIMRKKFYIQDYITGQNILKYTKVRGSTVTVTSEQLTSNDNIAIHGQLIMPEPTISFSHISLPKTNILIRANLNRHFIDYWELLTQNTDVTTKTINISEKPIAHDNSFLTNISEYKFEDNQDDDKDSTTNKYKMLLQHVFPNTLHAFELSKEYIKNGYTFDNILEHLEPFMIYEKDITHAQYLRFQEFVRQRIDDYKKTYAINKRKLEKTLSRFTNSPQETPYLLQLLQSNVYETFVKQYDFGDFDINSMSNSSFLNHIIKLDCGRTYNTMIAVSSLPLMIPYGTDQLKQLEELANAPLEEQESLLGKNTDKQTTTEEPDGDFTEKDIPDVKGCKKYILAKRYKAIDEMEEDNNKSTYFDKQYDKTFYDLLEEYKQYLSKDPDATLEENVKILSDKLKENVGMSLDDAVRDARAMLEKKRVVVDGDYCVVETDDDDTKYLYFVRSNNVWKPAEDISENMFGDQNKLFCNLTDKCLSVKDNCESLLEAEKSIKNKNLVKIITEFDKNLSESQSELESKIKKKLDISVMRLSVLIKIKHNKLYQYNREKYLLGGDINIEDYETSPHQKLRDLILGVPDFSLRQKYICQFVDRFTRPHNEGEDPWWRYCIEKNIKLLPTFIYELARVFMGGGDYNATIREICKRQGEYSDDGGAWVDKYSGYFITYIDFETDEGYEDGGFKKVSREILEKEAGTNLLNMNSTPSYHLQSTEKDKTTKMIHNVVIAIAEYMGINIQPYIEDIVKDTKLSLKINVASKEEYEKRKKGDYHKQFNTLLILISLSYYFIAVQTSIPSLQTRKRFPGCKRSFSGYPLEGEEDITGIGYIACIVSKISKSTIEPWSAMAKKKKDQIKTLMKQVMDKYIVPTQSVQRRLVKKQKYLSENKDSFIPIKLDIKNWINFMPPLKPIKLGTVQNIGPAFQKDFISDIKKGSIEQFNKIDTIKGKIIHFSLKIQELINSYVKKNDALLSNNSGEPYLENSCCDDGTINTLHYFEEKEKEIPVINQQIRELSNILLDTTNLGKAKILFFPKNTKPLHSVLSNDFSEETIYRAFIAFCRFNSSLPIDDELRGVCLEKPENFNVHDTIGEKIAFLKSSGKHYDQKQLHQLLSIINRKNILDLELNNKTITDVDLLLDILEYSNESESIAVPQTFRELFINYLQSLSSENPQINSEHKTTQDLLNYLQVSNEQMREQLIMFLRANTKKIDTGVIDNIRNLTTLEQAETEGIVNGKDETTFKTVEFMRNTIRFIVEVFPNIILNKVEPCKSNCAMPSHWKLSDFHNRDLINILNKYYSQFSSFFDDHTIEFILRETELSAKEIYEYAKYTKYYSPLYNNAEQYQSMFSSELCLGLFEYYLLSLFNNMISLTSQNKPVITIDSTDNISEETSSLSETTGMDALTMASQGDDEADDDYDKQLLLGARENNNNVLAKMIITICKLFISNKKTIAYNYKAVMNKVYKAKEQEKTDITDYLKEMSAEEREVENIFKNNKLGRWSTGLQKGFRTYQSNTYDQERDAIEQQAIMERKLGKNNVVTDMNRDIYMLDMIQEQATADEINAEVYSLSNLANDDDYGDLDGDEGY